MTPSAVAEGLPGQLAAIEWMGSGVKARDALITRRQRLFVEAWDRLNSVQRDDALVLAERLRVDQVRFISLLDEAYPSSLLDLKSPPPFLFVRGNVELLGAPGVGMCGSRACTPRGLSAAASCAMGAVRAGRTVMSGYARGVDMAAHETALEAGGATLIVLAEGIANFRVKKQIQDVFDWDRTLVVSQFATNARWSPGNAMTRNGLIAALGQTLVVVEAGETGGTINAARQGLAIGREVIALDYSNETPCGSQTLVREGAVPASTPGEFADLIAGRRRPESPGPAQDSFF